MKALTIASCAAVAFAAFAKTPQEVSKEHGNYPVRYCADAESEEARQALVAELWEHDPAAETKLWPEGKVPLKANDNPIKFLDGGLWARNLTVTDINDPFFTFFPAKGEGAKPVVVILPGGGYRSLGWNKEGTEIAEWLNSIGFSAAVLLYRAPEQRDAALCDMQRTIGILRRDASKYAIDPGRVGVIGFSAGANLAIRASTNWRKRMYERVDDADDHSCRPDFQLPIYPWDLRPRKVPSTPWKGWEGMDIRPEYPVDSETPPAFIAQSLDDVCEVDTAVAYDQSLQRAGVSSTARIYLDGGHGYGLRRLGHATDAWPDEAASWLAQFAQKPCAALALDGGGIKIEFDSAERGFDCLAIENKLGGKDLRFGDGASDGGRAGLWALKFWKDGSPSQTSWLTNHNPSRRSVKSCDGGLKFLWEGLSLGDETDAVDVAATVALAADGASAQWRISVVNRSKTWGLAEVEYPIIRHVVASNTVSALLPSGNMGGRLCERYSEGHYLQYPHGLVPVQTLAFMKDGAGLQFTTLDGKAQNKVFNTRGLDMKIWYRCPDEGRPGAANAPDYAVETAAFEGDWWVAAKRYRKWALKQQWASKGPLRDRKDFCTKIGNVGYWMIYGHGEDSPRDCFSKLAKLLPDVPLGCHFYKWHNWPYAGNINFPEMFPARNGVREDVAWMRENGVFCMPYINGSLWDDDAASFTNGLPGSCKKPDGSFYPYKCGDGNVLARMCPTTEIWKKTMLELTMRLFDELGVDGVYLDQVSCSFPNPCHDASHGHRLGGGEFWTQGYRELMKPIREDAARHGAGLTSECAAEPYIDSFDAFLTWAGNRPEDVPLLPAVYSGYTIYFGSFQSKNDSFDSYCALQARMFLWGIQLGWNAARLIDKDKEEYAPFTHRLCRARLENLDCFLYGELVGELIPVGEVPMVDVKWERDKVGEFKVPAITSAVWVSDKGERRAFIVNISDEERQFEFKFTPDGETHSVTVPPRDVVIAP